MISLFSLCFHTNTHLYPTGFTPLGVWTIGPKISRLINKFNSICITSFYFGQSFLCRHSSPCCGSGSSSFLMMSKATWKKNILLITYHFDPIYILYAHNSLRSNKFQVPMPPQGLFLYLKPLQGSLVQCMPLQGLLVHHMLLLRPFGSPCASTRAFCSPYACTKAF